MSMSVHHPCLSVTDHAADPELYAQWREELAAMSSRIIHMRSILHAELQAVS